MTREAPEDTVLESLILDLLEWISVGPDRSYEDVMDAWRTSCSKLPVWEEANRRSLLTTRLGGGRLVVKPTSLGLLYIKTHRARPV